MPLLFSYLIKLSISLAVVYLFYQFALRRLTFYNWNRWYLVGYCILSFIIASIDITPLLQRNQLINNSTIQLVPYLDIYNRFTGANNLSGNWTAWDFFQVVIVFGAIILFLRLLIQFFSLWKVRASARLVSNQEIRIYQVDDDIIPFSFGRSVFINSQLHSQEELEEIIRHEFVHVHQKHSIDIVLSEILCILNWYNPFAWFLRKAIRQNLEFIADQKVVDNGINRKDYQYLLLKVIGNNHFSIATKFNFSSLKKRIAMMNKLRSAKLHLAKFLFLVPVVAVLLLAFRKNNNAPVMAQSFRDTTPGKWMQPKMPEAIESIHFFDDVGTNAVSKKLEGTILIKRKDGVKEIYDINDSKSRADFKKKYGMELEGLIPPPPPPPVEPVHPITPKVPGGNEALNRVSTNYEVTKDRAVIHLKNGTTEEYDLGNKEQRADFEKKYGKIIETTVTGPTTVVSAITPNGVVSAIAPVAIVDGEYATTVAPTTVVGVGIGKGTGNGKGSGVGVRTITPVAVEGVALGTTVIAAATPVPGVIADEDYSYIITGNEDVLVTITKHTTRQQLDEFIKQMKEKDIELTYDKIEYNSKNELTAITGTMRSKDGHSNFVAVEFEKLILAMIKKGDKTYFKVSVKDKEVI